MTTQLHPNMLIEDEYEKLLHKLPTNLANVVRQKYEKDYEDFIAAAAEIQTSTDPADWANPNCGKCYGRGIAGKLYLTTDYKNEVPTDIQCGCAVKRYKKWLKNFRIEFNAKRETENGSKTE